MKTVSTESMETLSLDSVDFAELFRQAKDIQRRCQDYSVSNVSDKNMYFDGDTCKLRYTSDDKQFRSSAMTKHSLGQLCNKLGVPVRYLDKCIDSGMLELAGDNINSWIDEFGKSLFIREYNDTIRGVLSDRYSVLDTPDVLDVLDDVVDLNEYKIKGYFLTPERFHARIIQREMLNIEGEDLFAGIQIDSSDVGRSTLIATFMIFKQVCTNGLCVSKGKGVLFQQKHIGISSDDFHSSFSEAMHSIPSLVEESKILVEEARKSSDRYAIRKFTEEQMQDFIDRVKMKSKLSNDGVDKVVQLMTERYGDTKWGLINSLTEVAQDYTLERRIEIEKFAGELLMAA